MTHTISMGQYDIHLITNISLNVALINVFELIQSPLPAIWWIIDVFGVCCLNR